MSYVKQDEGGGGDTYTLRAAQSGADVDIQLDATTGSDSSVKLKAGTNITLTEASDTVSIDAAGGSPGGSNTAIQFNDGGSFGGDSDFTFDKTAGSEKVILSASSDQELMRITQTGTGKAFVVEDTTNPDTSRFEVNNLGQTAVQGTAGTNSAALYVGGTISSGSRIRAADGTTANPGYGFNSDTNTGLHRPASDTLAVITGGSERLRVASAGQIGLGGANYGTSGQVLTSGGPSGAVSWTTVSGGGSDPATQGVGYIQSKLFDSNTGVADNYALGVGGVGVSSGTTWNTTATDEVRLIPFVVPTTPTAAMQFAFRTLGTAGSTLYWAIYASDANGLPNGSPVSTHTVVTPTTFTTYQFTSGTSGTYSKGDLIWFAYFGQTTISSINMISGSGMFNIIPYSSTTATAPNQNAKIRTCVQATFTTAGVWDTLSTSTIYDDAVQLTLMPQVGITFS